MTYQQDDPPNDSTHTKIRLKAVNLPFAPSTNQMVDAPTDRPYTGLFYRERLLRNGSKGEISKGAGGREDRLKAFFTSEGDESNVPIALKTVAARIGAGIEVRSITYRYYVEFLVSQSKPTVKSMRKVS